MEDRYTDIQLNWPDANAAYHLCQGGACKYKVKREAGLTDECIELYEEIISVTYRTGVRTRFTDQNKRET